MKTIRRSLAALTLVLAACGGGPESAPGTTQGSSSTGGGGTGGTTTTSSTATTSTTTTTTPEPPMCGEDCSDSSACTTCGDAKKYGWGESSVCCGGAIDAFVALSNCLCEHCGSCGCSVAVVAQDPFVKNCAFSSCFAEYAACN